MYTSTNNIRVIKPMRKKLVKYVEYIVNLKQRDNLDILCIHTSIIITSIKEIG
jgi:hypothetical protein